jgi:hypothetical protein
MYMFGDSWDLYGSSADGTNSLYWDGGAMGNGGLSPGRFAGGRCWQTGGNPGGFKNSGSNDAIHHVTVAYLFNATLSGTGQASFLGFSDGATYQCSVVFRTDGALILVAGGPNSSTILATYAGAYNIQNQWFVYEIEVVIHPTASSFTVRTNNATTNSFTATGLNTRQGTANSYANRLTIGNNSGNGPQYFDDLLWRSDPASVPWIGDIRTYIRYPVSDVQAQFTRSAAPTTVTVNGFVNVMNPIAANAAQYVPFSPLNHGQITGASINCSNGGGGTGHVKMAVFADNSGVPGAVLATSNEITNPGNAVIAFTFASPPRVLRGTQYWLGFSQDASITYNVANSGTVKLGTAVLYASWPAANPVIASTGANVPGLIATITPQFNCDQLSEAQEDGSTTYLYDNNVGDNDLYTVSTIPVTPATVIAVAARAFAQKSDAGSRQGALQG